MKKLTFKVQGMECPNCAFRLEQIEDILAGVSKAEASYHKAEFIVNFNEDLVTEGQIQAQAQKLGYRLELD